MSSGQEALEAMAFSELSRRMNNSVRVGKIVEVDFQKARVRVSTGGLKTNWLPWLTQRAGKAKVWSPPKVGETVVMVAPSGELTKAFVVGSAFNQDYSAPGDDGNTTVIEFEDGTKLTYDQGSHSLIAKLGGSGTVTIEAAGGITIKGDTKIEGELEVTKDVSLGKSLDVSSDISAKGEIETYLPGAPVRLSSHYHTGVTPGPGISTQPVPGT